jgi:transcriptional regulator with XRE-family HTH domain
MMAMANSAIQRQTIIERMEALQVSTAELARQSGVHRGTIARALSEDPKHSPNTRTFDLLANALNKIAEARTGSLVGERPTPTKVYDAGSAGPSRGSVANRNAQDIIALYRSVLVIIEMSIARRATLTTEDRLRLFQREGLEPVARTKLARTLGLMTDSEAVAVHTVALLAFAVEAVGASAFEDAQTLRWIEALTDPAVSAEIGRVESADDRLAIAANVLADICAHLLAAISRRGEEDAKPLLETEPTRIVAQK